MVPSAEHDTANVDASTHSTLNVSFVHSVKPVRQVPALHPNSHLVSTSRQFPCQSAEQTTNVCASLQNGLKLELIHGTSSLLSTLSSEQPKPTTNTAAQQQKANNSFIITSHTSRLTKNRDK